MQNDYKAIGSYIGAAPHASFLNCARAFNVSEDGLGRRANNICKRNKSSLLIHTRVQDGVCTQRIIEKKSPSTHVHFAHNRLAGR